MKAKREKPVCAECGSDDVRADAYAEWNVDTQQWEVSATFDKGAVCETCGGECSLKWVTLPTRLEAKAPPCE